MTPSLRGRIATMLAGVRPTIRLASAPMASTLRVFLLIATTDGSLMTTPLPRTRTRVLAVPRSIPISLDIMPRMALNGLNTGPSRERVRRYGANGRRRGPLHCDSLVPARVIRNPKGPTYYSMVLDRRQENWRGRGWAG